MPVRRRKQPGRVVYRPQMPDELWAPPPVDVAEPGPDASRSEWARWEQAIAGAYREREAARAAWVEEHAHLPADPAHMAAAINMPDEPFCGELEQHECLGVDCQEQPPACGEPEAELVAGDLQPSK